MNLKQFQNENLVIMFHFCLNIFILTLDSDSLFFHLFQHFNLALNFNLMGNPLSANLLLRICLILPLLWLQFNSVNVLLSTLSTKLVDILINLNEKYIQVIKKKRKKFTIFALHHVSTLLFCFVLSAHSLSNNSRWWATDGNMMKHVEPWWGSKE